jgi:MoxR-like ATPase
VITTVPRDSGHPAAILDDVLAALDRIVLGKHRTMRLALTCLLAGGHLLIEDVPGVGKTTLAQALARVLGLDFRRIQFTSDMMPADIIGASIYQRSSESFRFERGPLFAQMVLADEINRASPKTQSALLEAMQEEQVTIDGVSHRLPEPFFVIGTRNPVEQIGTFALPESQLDRFMMQIRMGYPDPRDERDLLLGRDRREVIADQEPVLGPAALAQLRTSVRGVHVADPLLDYLQSILQASRESRAFVTGLSPRSGIALLAAARAWAFLSGRMVVYPDDVQAVLPAVVAHRLQLLDAAASGREPADLLLETVAIP